MYPTSSHDSTDATKRKRDKSLIYRGTENCQTIKLSNWSALSREIETAGANGGIAQRNGGIHAIFIFYFFFI